MTPPFESGIALYYPWVSFQDDNWLKLAMLTWNTLARIRPDGFDDSVPGGGRDSGELVRRLQDETDFILDLTPGDADLRAVSAALDDFTWDHRGKFDEFPEYRDLTVPSADVGRPDRALPEAGAHLMDDRLPRQEMAEAWDPPGMAQTGPASSWVPPAGPPRPDLTWVYAGTSVMGGKMNATAMDSLAHSELAVQDPRGGPWLGMRPRMASVYLTLLADAMARHNRLCPVTDDPLAHAARGTLDRLADLVFGDRSRDAGAPESAYLHLAVNAVIRPERLDRLPVGKLIAFRQRYSAELTAFRQHVAGLAPELRAVAEVENVQVARAHLQAIHDRTTKPQLDELRRALRGLGVESAAGTLGLKVDLGAAAGTVLGAAAAAGGQFAVAGATVAVTVLPYVAGRIREAGRLKRESPVAYLLAVDRKLAGAARARGIGGRPSRPA